MDPMFCCVGRFGHSQGRPVCEGIRNYWLGTQGALLSCARHCDIQQVFLPFLHREASGPTAAGKITGAQAVSR